MKWIYAVLFSFLTLAGILKDLAVFINFQANQEFIVMTMCTGASEPVNTCNGSCYLTKQLKLVHDHDGESESQVPTNHKNNLTYFNEEIEDDVKPTIMLMESSVSMYFYFKTDRGHPSIVYQPPKYS